MPNPNPAPADHPIHDLIRNRWSPRAFSPTPVDPKTLASLFEAARWAPSCYNDQPWRYVYARKEDAGAFARVLSCIVEANQAWCKGAPVLAISVASTMFGHNGQPNMWGPHDTGAASMLLSIQAQAMGLVVHQMGGFDPVKAREALKIPANFAPQAAIAIGYQGEPDSLPANLKERELAPRSRKPVASFAFEGVWTS